MPNQQEISSTSQDFLEIFDITRNAVILKDGTVSIILVISAMNFGLLAEQEQDAIIYAYAALLNSLNFPIQIMIRSKTKDATAYLKLLETQANKASSNEKQALIRRYQTFVSQLIKERNVLDKKFYVVIPALPLEVGMVTAESVLPGKSAPKLTRDQKNSVLEKGLGILEPRRDHMIAQFNRIGLYAKQIETQEIIEIFYSSYNPGSSEGQQITDSLNYTTMMVNAKTTLPTPPAQPITATQPNIEPEPADGYAGEQIKPVAPMQAIQQMHVEVQPVIEEQPTTATQPNIEPTSTLSESVPDIVQSVAEIPVQPVVENQQPPQPAVQTQPQVPSPLPPVAEL